MADVSGGTPTQRDKSQGPPLTKDWWTSVGENILRRTLPYGQGDGPDPKLTEGLGKALLVVFGNDAEGDMGEGRVRQFLATSASTDMLREELANNLVARSAPAIQARLRIRDGGEFGTAAASSQGGSAASPGAAPASAVSAGAARAATSKAAVSKQRRPTPPPRNGQNDYWQNWIYADLARAQGLFDQEYDTRRQLFDTFANAFDGDERKKFESSASATVNADEWRSRFNRALVLASGAKVGLAIDDDAYHLTAPPPQPLPSNWFIGELVHATYQFQYLAAREQNDVLAEFWVRYRPPQEEAQFVDYRTLSESDPLVGPAQYAFGRYRPDLIDFGERTVYEIKPMRGAPFGVLQLWRYAHNFNLARLFDDIVAEGRGQKEETKNRYALAPGSFPKEILHGIELTQYIDGYLKYHRGVDKKKTWSYISARRARGERLWAFPVLVPSIPGLVLYSVHTDEESPEKRKQAIEQIVTTGLIVVASVALVALIAAALIATGGVAAAATATALAEGTAAAETAAVATESAVVVTGGESVMVIEEFSSAMQGVDGMLSTMRATSSVF